jgi:hypothetical protein
MLKSTASSSQYCGHYEDQAVFEPVIGSLLWIGVPKIIWRIASNDHVFVQKVSA